MADNTDIEIVVNNLIQLTSIRKFYNARYKNLGIYFNWIY
jgi:hypothetical protein